MSAPVLHAGDCIAETWSIVNRVGSGAHGSVYQVEHRFLGRQALKLLHVEGVDVSALVNEARILASILHPNVLRVFDAGVIELKGQRLLYLATEFVAGGTIEDMLKTRIRIEPGDVLSATEQILAGLQATHELSPPVLHRDLIPSNILVSRVSPLEVKLGDFAIAQQMPSHLGLARVEGVVRYLPPEARLGYLDVRSDLYAVGLIAYQMLTGVFPFRSSNSNTAGIRLDDMLAERLTPPPRPSSFRQDISPGIDGLVMKALAPRAIDRFSTAREFRDAVLGMIAVR